MRKTPKKSSPGWLTRWLAVSALACQSVHAALTFTPAPEPELDMSQLGRVALAGDFDGISLYQYIGQGQNPGSTNGSHALFSRFPNGLFNALTSADGNIQSICPYKSGNDFKGLVVGGNFTSLGGIETPGIALYNVDTEEITPMRGITGRVDSLLCDDEDSTVYVGGTFLANQSANAVAWNGDWKHLPFQGFNGPVRSIAKGSAGNVLFGGSFTGLGSKKSKNLTRDDEKRLREVPISSANLWSNTDMSSWTGNSDPRNLICTTGNEDVDGKVWFGPDNGPASLQADFKFFFTPAKLRLWNTNLANHGTKTFRFTAFPINGILNFTYVDPQGNSKTCDAWCPLPQGNTTYQDFYFVNEVAMNSFRLDLNEWYGSGPGLSGLQLFEDRINDYAINDFNQPSCQDGMINGAESKTTGPWLLSEVGLSSSQYLTAYIPSGPVDPESLTVTIKPEVVESGNYSVLIFTPGCTQDGSCATRGKVTVTAKLRNDNSNELLVAEVWQTNNFDKYDRIFFSFVDASDDTFRPAVTIKPSAGQNGPVTIVAQSIRFDLASRSGGLNGLYEFDTSRTKVDSDVSTSVYNKAGRRLDRDAEVYALSHGDTTYVAGNFTADGMYNALAVNHDGSFGLSNGGLDDKVVAIHRDDTYVYFGGKFQNTHDRSIPLAHVGRYHLRDNTWSTLGGGVNGLVQYLAPISVNVSDSETVSGIAVSGEFNLVNGFGNNEPVVVDSIAIWIPKKNDWLVNVYPDGIALSGRLTAVSTLPDKTTIYAGDISSQALAVSGAVGLRSTPKIRLERLPLSMSRSNDSVADNSTVGTNSTLSRRAQVPLLSTGQTQGAVTGLMYNENALNITILGGHFDSQDSDGKPVHNLLMVNGTDDDFRRGLPDGLSQKSVVRALGTHKTSLFVGGTLSGSVNDNPVRGMVVYDLQRADFASTQPPALAGDSVVVNAITASKIDGSVFVGGKFDGAGSFRCPALCVYSTERAQWQNPSGNVEGTVSVLSWIDQNSLYVGGNFSVQGEAATIRTYHTAARTFTPLTGGEAPGQVTTLTPATVDSSQIFVGGTTAEGKTYLAKHDGTRWHTIDGFDGSKSVIRGLQVFTTKKNHDNTDLLERNRALLILGSLDLPDIGPVSAAIYDGKSFTPFALTSSNSDGRTGSLAQAFVQNPSNFFASQKKHLALGFVVLIGLALALVLTALLILAFVVAAALRRGKDEYVPVSDSNMMRDREDALARVPPHELFRDLARSPSAPQYAV